MVRVTLGASRVLQDVGRVPAAQPALPAGRARMHARRAQTA
jgi:hypothetical protein